MVIKRKGRNNINKNKLDMTKPIDITQFGGEEDPCFGKHHDPRAPECKKCGDAEICSIICGQKLHVIRELEEKQNKYKDVQPDEMKPEKTLNQVVIDKLNSEKGEMKVIILAKYLKKVLPEYKNTELKPLTVAIKKKFKVSSLFTLYKEKGKTYIKLKQS